VYGSFPPWGKSVEFPANGGGGGGVYKEAWDENRNSALYQDYALVKTFYNRQLVICPPSYIVGDSYARNNLVAIYYDDTQFIYDPEAGILMPYSEYLSAFTDNPTGGRNMTREEFYDVKVLVLAGFQYKFDEGMTWAEWCNSDYNTRGFIIEDGLLKLPEGSFNCRIRMWNGDNGELVYGDDIIRPATNYVRSNIN
jgi:hypothetical protein